MRYEACGVRFRMHNYVTHNGGSINNGMASTVSERIQSWLDADGRCEEQKSRKAENRVGWNSRVVPVLGLFGSAVTDERADAVSALLCWQR